MKEQTRKKRVLVVDNHPLILKYMRRLLEKRGDEVLTAEDGLAALKILRTEKPDVIFVDQIMPNISGDKLCRIIRSRPDLEDICIVVLSAVAAEEEVRFLKFGANYCIAKGPFDRMSTHILALLYKLDAEKICGSSDRVIGREDVYYRQISKELLHSKRHSEVILNHVAEGVLELTLGGEIIYANPTAVEIIGQPEVEILASPFADIFDQEGKERILSLIDSLTDSFSAGTGDLPIVLNDRPVSLKLLKVDDETHQAITVIIEAVTRYDVPTAEAVIDSARLASCVNEFGLSFERIREILGTMRKELSGRSDESQNLDRLETAFRGLQDTFNELLSTENASKKP
jgi:CheY-like chemotaxis protein